MNGDDLARGARIGFAITVTAFTLAFVPLPEGWARSLLRTIRSADGNLADRDNHAAGYYVGLIDGANMDAHDELSMRLIGKPADWPEFREFDATHFLPGDFLQFELRPNLDRRIFDRPFQTNAFGLRDRAYAQEKPAGTFRIALLGSSMDMGWGVGGDETYEQRLEDWLNAHAAKRGLRRRFEVLNFAMAAYSPLHRLESFRRKALGFYPDLVIYSTTMLDTRLLEIHLCWLLAEKVDLAHDWLRRSVAEAGLTPADLGLDAQGELAHKDAVKAKLKPHLWEINDQALGALAAACRSEGIPLVALIIPRVGQADAPETRAPAVARLQGIAAHHAVPLIDLSRSFDDHEPTTIEIAPWDDHPNALGHKLLFLGLARGLVKHESVYRLLFEDSD